MTKKLLTAALAACGILTLLTLTACGGGPKGPTGPDPTPSGSGAPPPTRTRLHPIAPIPGAVQTWKARECHGYASSADVILSKVPGTTAGTIDVSLEWEPGGKPLHVYFIGDQAKYSECVFTRVRDGGTTCNDLALVGADGKIAADSSALPSPKKAEYRWPGFNVSLVIATICNPNDVDIVITSGTVGYTPNQ